jgi:hypothetical protein
MKNSSINSSFVGIEGFLAGNDTWFSPQPGLNVVYGKNGTGKSTLVNFVSAVTVGRRNRSRTVRTNTEGGYGRVFVRYQQLRDVSGADVLAKLFRDLHGEIEKTYIGKRRRSSEFLDEDGLADLLVVDEDIDDADNGPLASLESFLELEMEEDDSRLLRREMSSMLEIARLILAHDFNEIPFEEVSRALSGTLKYHYSEWASDEASFQAVNERFKRYGVEEEFEQESDLITRNAIDDLSLFHRLVLFIDVIISRLDFELNHMNLDPIWFDEVHKDKWSSLEEQGKLTYSSVRDDADHIIGVIARAVHEQLHSPLFSFESPGGKMKSWEIRIAIATHTTTDGVGPCAAALEELFLEWSDGSSVDETDTFQLEVRRAWLYDSMVVGFWRLHNVMEREAEALPIVEIHFPLGETDYLPVDVFRLDEELDVSKVVAGVAKRTIGRELFEVLALEEETDVGESDVGDELLADVSARIREVLSPVSDFVASLGIGVETVDIEVSRNVADWVAGEGVELLFRGANSIPQGYMKLSTAQQFWVKAGFWFAAARQSEGRILVVADEPDRSLHERAAYNVMTALADSGLDVIVSSHSVAALRTRSATIHHLEIGPNGHRTISELAVGEDVLVAAERLGTTPYDLLSLKRMMVLVEGAHDAAVVNKLIDLGENRLLKDRVLVAPMRGVKNVISAADSVLVTEFSELQLLVMVDNGRNEVFHPILAELREMDSNGATEREMKQRLASLRSAHDATFEERVLFDLLERAVHRGVLRRLDLFALSVGDVIELLPASGFGATQDWADLRRQYQRSSVRADFKSWLKDQHGLAVSVRTVERAFASSDSLHPELTRLLQHIELGCASG